jgi:hypothetical protein
VPGSHVAAGRVDGHVIALARCRSGTRPGLGTSTIGPSAGGASLGTPLSGVAVTVAPHPDTRDSATTA